MAFVTVHDGYFKYVLGQQEVAGSFIFHNLPQELVAKFDLSTLAVRKDSFIDPELAEHFSDMIYEVSLRDGSAGEIYFLFEHKSYSKRATIFDLLRYMVKMWRQQSEQMPKGKMLVLKPILPILICHGASAWSAPTRFIELFNKQLPANLKPYVPDYQMVVCDLSQYSDSEIKGEVRWRVAAQIWKHLYTGELAARLPSILGLLDELEDKETGLEYVEATLRYLSMQKVAPLSTAELKETVLKVISEGEEIMLSLAEQWMAEGHETGFEEGHKKGHEEGEKKGHKKGRQEGERETLRHMSLRLLEGRFGKVPVDLMLRTEKMLTDQLTRLFDLAVNATSLDEVERALV